MGHSSLAVSLTYLRGLEVSELEESDMPVMQKKKPVIINRLLIIMVYNILFLLA